jgi:hypothetical protein
MKPSTALMLTPEMVSAIYGGPVEAIAALRADLQDPDAVAYRIEVAPDWGLAIRKK